MAASLIEAYRRRIAEGKLEPDPGQRAALEHLQSLSDRLGSVGRRLFGRSEPPKGLYLWGPVGRGKSMLMDLFFAAAPVARKRRAHFHEFMAETHRRIGVWRSGDPARRKATFGQTKGDDPIAPTAELIASEVALLCFDELEVNDIADAMILGRLFEALFARGVTLVATSNRPPTELYKNGLNRQLFTQFIGLLESRLEIVEVAGDLDHRRIDAGPRKAWLFPIDPDNERTFEALWTRALAGEPEVGVTLEVLGRRQHWPRASGDKLHAHFVSLCGHALGPEDYLAIAQRFAVVFIEAVPKLGPDKRDQARRFSILIDALYEARRRIVVLAAAEPDQLYPAGDLAFEFQRTVSRLHEMRSDGWAENASR